MEDIKFLKNAYEGVTLDELYDIEKKFVEKENEKDIKKKMKRTARRRERSRDD